MKVLVIGAGLMGSQIGCEYALGGHNVAFLARHPDEARARVEGALAMVQELGLFTAEQVTAARSRITISAELEAGSRIDLAVESIPEDFALKVEVLRRVAGVAPDAVLATNTSSLSIGELGRAVGKPEFTIGTHYWNPPLLMPPVEIIRGEHTDRSVVAFVREAIGALGKEPILVERDVPGFAWNRLQMALLREALWLVENGVASPKAVDEVIRSGLARRWRLTGPFETVALGGVETWTRAAARILPALSSADRLEGLARWVPDDPNALAAARERRDRALAEELLRERAE
jgi:3-hydroxybutyryl-CoA dehydrogenase